MRTIVCTGSTSDCGRPDGWVLDLAEAGERVNVEMKLVLGALVFASNVPEEIPCTVGGHSWFNQVDFRFGVADPERGLVRVPVRFAQRRLQRAAAAGQQRSRSDLHRQLPPERRQERQEGPAPARFASAQQAHQLAGDPAVGR